MGPASSDGIVIPGSSWKDDPIQHGLIVALGPHCAHIAETASPIGASNGRPSKVYLQEGDHVLYKRVSATPFKLGGVEFMLTFDSEVVGVVQEEE